ncbi:MAG: metallophosphoesterase [Phycisphaerales bacterium]|nr:metallophosphoesterase [Phycisphaerales bacterium]
MPDTDASIVDVSQFSLVARIAHISDAQVVDEESPGRFASAAALNSSAWRPQERYSVHLLDGTIRAVNAYHAQVAPVDFLIHTGDAADNDQLNEVRWFLDCFDGKIIDPLTGVDDRAPADRGPPELDPHVPFRAEGLYRTGTHGDAATIPWYAVMGNHDRYAVGVFPIISGLDGGLFSPLPAGLRLGLFLPVVLVPEGALAYGPVTPAHPGPPPELLLPSLVMPNPDRRFVTMDEVLAMHRATVTGPGGHGFGTSGRSWYAVNPVPGLRLIVLDTSVAAFTVPAGVYDAGAIVPEQVAFLKDEIAAAEAADELVIVATHHPSETLSATLGTALSGAQLVALLNAHPCVVAHLAGHTHRQRIVDRGGYLEVETGAIIDWPQEGRIIEVWRAGDDVELRYTTISHLYTGSAFSGVELNVDDPLLEMRRVAFQLAVERAGGL